MMAKKAAEWVTQSEFARRLGVSQPRIAFFLREGRLSGATKRLNNRILIDVEKGKKILETRIDPMNPSKIREAVRNLSEGEKKEAVKTAGVRTTLDYSQARTLNEQYKAAIKKLEYEEKTGKLINAEVVKAAAFDCARRTRDAILNVPDRVSALLAAESREGAVRSLLTAELRSALEELSQGMI
jgi:hypothetical protein